MIDDNKDLSLNYKIYWITAVILLIIGFIKGDDLAMDIQLHDTYFVLDLRFVYDLLGVVYCIFGLFSFIAIKIGTRLNFFLSKLHCFGTISLILILFWNPLVISWYPPRRYYTFEGMDPGFFVNSISQIIEPVLLIMIVLLQVIYVLNFFERIREK